MNVRGTVHTASAGSELWGNSSVLVQVSGMCGCNSERATAQPAWCGAQFLLLRTCKALQSASSRWYRINNLLSGTALCTSALCDGSEQLQHYNPCSNHVTAAAAHRVFLTTMSQTTTTTISSTQACLRQSMGTL
jgi:hypothetical protein